MRYEINAEMDDSNCNNNIISYFHHQVTQTRCTTWKENNDSIHSFWISKILPLHYGWFWKMWKRWVNITTTPYLFIAH